MNNLTKDQNSHQNEIAVSPLGGTKKISLMNTIRNNGDKWSTCVQADRLVLEDGIYDLADSIIVDYPLEIVARNPGKVTIKGNDLSNHLVMVESDGKLLLRGIRFKMENKNDPT